MRSRPNLPSASTRALPSASTRALPSASTRALPSALTLALTSALGLALLACGGPPTLPDGSPGGRAGLDAQAAGEATHAASAHPGPGPDPGFLEAYGATYRFRLGRPTDFAITPGGADVLFLQSGPRDFTRALYRADPQTGAVTTLLTADKLLDGADETLTPEERARRERLRLAARGIARFTVAEHARRVLVPLSGRLFVHDLAEARTYALPDDGPAQDAHLSPDGTRVAVVRGGEVHLVTVASGASRALTAGASADITFGLPEFVAQEEMDRQEGLWWAPDGQHLAYQRTDTTGMERLHLGSVERPTAAPEGTPYPRPGQANAQVQLYIQALSAPSATPSPSSVGRGRRGTIGRAAKSAVGRGAKLPMGRGPKALAGRGALASGGPALPAAVEVRWDHARWPYLARFVWPKAGTPTLVVQNRTQTELQVLAVNPDTGATTPLLTETDAAWINLDPQMPRWLADGSGFLWTSERTGAWQLELRRADGSLSHAVTPKDFAYDGLVRLDAETGAVWVRGAADPTRGTVFALPLAGGQPVPVATDAGLNDVTARGDAKISIHQFSPEVGPPSWSLRPLTEPRAGAAPRLGAPVAVIGNQAEALPFEVRPTWHAVTAEGRIHHAQVVLPRGHQPGWRYPVVVAVYGGPHVRLVRRHADAYAHDQWLADHGFAVVRIDGRGTTGRGRAWERAIHKDFATVPLNDQAAALQALGALEPALDLSRVGIYGWSFGGYLSALAVLRRPDVFHAAMAGAPVTDWLDYDTHYTERYLGLPEGEPGRAVYAGSSLLDDAPKLKRPLLLVHGTGDDNVWFSHALKLSDALLRAGRPHDFLPLMGHAHMVSDVDVNRGLYARITSFFVQHLGRPTAP